MRHLFVLYNIAFLLFGQTAITTIHYLEEHAEDHKAELECLECIQFSNSNNYISNSDEVRFINQKTVLFVGEYISNIEFQNVKIFKPRAPPFSL